MTHRGKVTLKSTIALVAATVLVLTLTPSAQAAPVHRFRDASHDTANYNSTTWKQRAQADLVRVRYGPGVKRTWVQWKVRNLRKHVRNPYLTLNSGWPKITGWAGRYSIDYIPWKGGAVLYRHNGEYLVRKCARRGRTTVNYRKDTIQVSFPKKCFARGYRIVDPYARATYTPRSGPQLVKDVRPNMRSFTPRR